MRAQKKAEELAAQRVQLLSPLLVGGGLDPAKARKIRAEICKQTGLSDHTLRRYLTKYREDGFEELKPKSKERSQAEDAIPQHILEQAILLHREIPNRNVAQIIQILEWEGKVRHGQIKRSTLQEKLANRGYNTQHMRMYSQSGGVTRRYQ